MDGIAGDPAPVSRSAVSKSPRSGAKRARIIEMAGLYFAEHGYHAARVGDIAANLGIAKGSIFQHFGSKDGLFLEVYKRAVCSFPKYLDAPAEVRSVGFFEVLYYWLSQTEPLLREDPVRYRISLLGNYGTDIGLKREINRFLVTEDPFGTMALVRFGVERGELRQDVDVEIIVSILDWMMHRFQDALIVEERDAGFFRRQDNMAEKNEARVQQLIAVLQRAVGARGARAIRGRRRVRTSVIAQ